MRRSRSSLPVVAGADGVVIALASRSTEELSSRVVIVSQNALLRDILARVLAESGVSVVAAFPDAQLVTSTLHEGDYDVIFYEAVETDTCQAITQAILFGPVPLRSKKVIVLGPGYLVTLLYHKEVVHDASMGDLVARTRFISVADEREVFNIVGVP